MSTQKNLTKAEVVRRFSRVKLKVATGSTDNQYEFGVGINYYVGPNFVWCLAYGTAGRMSVQAW